MFFVTYNACSAFFACTRVQKVCRITFNEKKQNVTIRLSVETVQETKVLAARRFTSISALLAEQIESLVNAEELYERSARAALALLETGFHLGGVVAVSRDELHER